MVRAFTHGAMGHRIDHSWGEPIELFLVPASAPRLVNKGCGMCYPVCGMVHIKEPLLLIGKSRLCGGSRFSFSLSEWSLTICLMPYNLKYNVLSVSLNRTFSSLFMLCCSSKHATFDNITCRESRICWHYCPVHVEIT